MKRGEQLIVISFRLIWAIFATAGMLLALLILNYVTAPPVWLCVIIGYIFGSLGADLGHYVTAAIERKMERKGA